MFFVSGLRFSNSELYFKVVWRSKIKVLLSGLTFESPWNYTVLMFKEFKEFAVKGNVIDLAVGVIIGAAFGKIISSLVSDIIMPPLSLLLGKVNFSNLYINLSGTAYQSLSAAKAAGAPTINYGLFLNNILDFVIVAFVIFLMVKQINKLKKKPAAPNSGLKDCPFCFSKIHLKQAAVLPARRL